MTKNRKTVIPDFRGKAAIYLITMALPLTPTGKTGRVSAVLWGDRLGYHLKAVTNILHGQVFDENFLMTVATVGAMFLGEYAEGVAVMLFYQVGELFQSYAVSKSRRSISGLMDIRPDYANVVREDGIVSVDPDEVAVGEVIVVKPGERVPLDGTILEGRSALNTSALTGNPCQGRWNREPM